jgi:hypothetical protein
MDKTTKKFYEQFDNWELEMYFGKIDKSKMTKEQRDELVAAQKVVAQKKKKKRKGE